MMQINRKNARVWSMLGMRRTLGLALESLIEMDETFAFATADVSRYFGVEKFSEKYPDRLIDVGIAEQNLVSVATGLTKEGINVFAASYSTFATARALDQIRVGMGYMGVGVKLIGVGAGLAEGDLSPTHMGLDDVAYLRAIPHMTIVCPSDAAEMVKVLEAMLKHDGPVYLRLTGRTNLPIIHTEDYHYEIGRSEWLRTGQDIALIASGCIVDTALKVAKQLDNEGYNCTVINMHTIKPIDTACLIELEHYQHVFVVEEHMQIGGLGSAISEFYAQQKEHPIVKTIGIEGAYPLANEYDRLLEICELNEDGILRRVKAALNAGR